MVVIVDGNEVSELEMASKGSSLGSNTLLGASITKENKGVVVNEVVSWLVEDTLEMGLTNGDTDSVGETLSERTGGDLNTWGIVLEEILSAFNVSFVDQAGSGINIQLLDVLESWIRVADWFVSIVFPQSGACEVVRGKPSRHRE